MPANQCAACLFCSFSPFCLQHCWGPASRTCIRSLQIVFCATLRAIQSETARQSHSHQSKRQPLNPLRPDTLAIRQPIRSHSRVIKNNEITPASRDARGVFTSSWTKTSVRFGDILTKADVSHDRIGKPAEKWVAYPTLK